jgi:hypothetical protein
VTVCGIKVSIVIVGRRSNYRLLKLPDIKKNLQL